MSGLSSKTIILVSCVKSKLKSAAKAKDLYTSTLFKYNMTYAKSFHPDQIFILSAKYGLLGLNDFVEPYEKTLNSMGKQERVAWANAVLARLTEQTDLSKDRFIFLAGARYRELLLPKMKFYEVPFEGLSFGQQLQELKKRIGRT